jgi:hypothetical protein
MPKPHKHHIKCIQGDVITACIVLSQHKTVTVTFTFPLEKWDDSWNGCSEHGSKEEKYPNFL